MRKKTARYTGVSIIAHLPKIDGVYGSQLLITTNTSSITPYPPNKSVVVFIIVQLSWFQYYFKYLSPMLPAITITLGVAATPCSLFCFRFALR